MSRITILGVPIDALTRQQAALRIRAMLASNMQHHVMTPNSEMLVESTHNPTFKKLLCSSALNVPDSAGLLWAARITGQRLPERVTGVDTVEKVCAELSADCPVFLLGAAPGIAEAAAAVLQQRNPSIVIAGTHAGSPRMEDSAAIIERINRSGAKLLLVAYGAPAQDVWIGAHLKAMPLVRVAMGVGGTFDFLAGYQKRAPRFIQRLSLEWLWRVVREPKRLPRIWRAVVVFPWKVLKNRPSSVGYRS